MTHKERMLRCIRGGRTDTLPFAPRLDLWYKANRQAGTLPGRYRKASLDDIIEDLDAGCHAVIPDYQQLDTPGDDMDRGLGIFNLPDMPHTTELGEVERAIRKEGPRTWTEYRTPVGTVSTCVVYTPSMEREGITMKHVEKHAVENLEDYKVLTHIFRHARLAENHAGYRRFAERIGDRGIAVAYVNAAASPMHLILRDLVPFDRFFSDVLEHPEVLDELVESMTPYWNEMLDISAGSSADVLMLGANYDANLTYPPLFDAHFTPWLKKFSEMLHAKDKFLLTHTDGENTGLLDAYLRSGIDVADSVCPAPMTRLGIREVRDAFGERVTIMGGIPSVALLPDSMSDRDYSAYLDRFFRDIGEGSHIIVGISDTTPPGSDFNRILQLKKRVEAFNLA